jgi:hypothetical protein
LCRHDAQALRGAPEGACNFGCGVLVTWLALSLTLSAIRSTEHDHGERFPFPELGQKRRRLVDAIAPAASG